MLFGKYLGGARWLCAAFTLLASGVAIAQSESATANVIESINVARHAGSVVVKLDLKKPLTAVPVSFSVANPARFAVDLPGTANGLGKNSQTFNEGLLRSVNVIQATDKTRLVFNLNQSAASDIRLDGNSLLVTLSGTAAVERASSPATRFSESVARQAAYQVRDIGFRRGMGGEGRVVVDLSDTGAGIDIRQKGTQLLVEFDKTALPEHLRKKLDVTDFATPVVSVVASQEGDLTRLAITPKGLWEHNAYQTDTQFIIEVKPVIENPNKLVQGSRGGYQGEKLSLNFQNVDVRRLLQVIGEFTGMNMVVSDTVGGNLTLILKDVPWDQALDIILQQRGLDMRKNGNVILVAPRDEIATKEKLEYESRQQISDLEPLRSESIQLNYHKAKAVFDFLKNKDQTILSKRGSVIVDERSNKLFINDVPSRLDDLRRLIAEIDIPVRQVLIEARIVEASDTFSKDLGIRLGLGGRGDQNPFRIGTDSSFLRGNIATGSSLTAGGNGVANNYNVNLPASPRSGTPGALSFTLWNSARTQFLGLEISALEADGRGKIVSSPRVVTADQVEALIEQGVEIPYLSATSAGATQVQFKKANLALKVRPQITPDGKITLTVDVNKDKPTYLQGGQVAIDTKHVKTEILVDNGGTVVIGGIYTQETTTNNSRIPVLGEIPYLGWLFRSTRRIDDKNELLVFLTPRIVSDSLQLR